MPHGAQFACAPVALTRFRLGARTSAVPSCARPADSEELLLFLSF
jgi:hypothetical protein